MTQFETADKTWVRLADVRPGEMFATQTDLMRWTRRRRNGSPRVLIRTEDPYRSKLWEDPDRTVKLIGDKHAPTSPSQKVLRVRLQQERSRIIMP